jgi:myo-inositol-1(or 4)-monophosphatase
MGASRAISRQDLSRHAATLLRIQAAFEAARAVLRRFKAGAVSSTLKPGHGPVTEADSVVAAALRATLLRHGEGWLSEESSDDFVKEKAARVWVVDALDGTQEFVKGIPEYSMSVAMVEDGVPVAGGICNPATQETFLGSLDGGVTYNGLAAGLSSRPRLEGAVVLASRSEVHRGEWQRFSAAPFAIRPTGSIAYKLALVSAGLADATFTLTPKHVWDVAAGIALVTAAGGIVRTLPSSDAPMASSLLISGLLACAPHLAAELAGIVESARPKRALA